MVPLRLGLPCNRDSVVFYCELTFWPFSNNDFVSLAHPAKKCHSLHLVSKAKTEEQESTFKLLLTVDDWFSLSVEYQQLQWRSWEACSPCNMSKAQWITAHWHFHTIRRRLDYINWCVGQWKASTLLLRKSPLHLTPARSLCRRGEEKGPGKQPPGHL